MPKELLNSWDDCIWEWWCWSDCADCPYVCIIWDIWDTTKKDIDDIVFDRRHWPGIDNLMI